MLVGACTDDPCDGPCELDDQDSTGDLGGLRQGWSPAEQRAFYDTSFGGGFVPGSFIRALETPDGGKFVDALPSMGFVPDPESAFGVAGLIERQTAGGPMFTATCAGCHTAELNYRGKTMRVDGIGGLMDLTKFNAVLGASMIATANDPAKFERFAASVLGPAVDDPALKAQIRGAVDAISAGILAQAQLGAQLGLYPIANGFGRVDAFNGIRSSLLGPLSLENLRPIDAPVSVPPVWDMKNLDWNHYDASSNQRIHRNMANGAVWMTGFSAVDPATYAMAVDVRGTHQLQQLTDELRAPRWPENILGKIDRAAAARGKAVYASACGSCHEPATVNGKVQVVVTPLDEIGTDRSLYDTNHSLVADPTALGLPRNTPIAVVLTELFDRVLAAGYAAEGIDAAEQARIQDSPVSQWRNTNGYKANALHGVWATAPYLHNGSVPNLHELLLPVAQRSAKFSVGGKREFDPVRVGFDTAPSADGSELDTSLAGNRNTGHEYGVELTDSQKRDLLEYLKIR